MRRMSSLRHAGDADSAAMIESVLLKLHGRAQAARGRRDSTSLPIRLDVTVMDLWNADVKSETFDTKVRVRARWLCPKEHAEEALQHGEDGLDADWEPEWVPHISFACTTSEALDHSYFIAQREGELTWITGEWTFTARIVSRSPSAPLPAATPAAPLTRAVAHTAPCPTYLPWQLEAYDLHHFPFDVQDFNIILSIDNADVGIELKAIDSTAKLARSPKKWRTWNTMATDKTPVRVDAAALELPDFRTLSERDDGTNWLERPALFRKTDNNEVHIVLLYERNPSFYVVNYMLLLFFISSSVAFSWSVPWPKVEDRLALDVTLLLTSVAFKQVLAGTVPPISYLTRIDAVSCEASNSCAAQRGAPRSCERVAPPSLILCARGWACLAVRARFPLLLAPRHGHARHRRLFDRGLRRARWHSRMHLPSGLDRQRDPHARLDLLLGVSWMLVDRQRFVHLLGAPPVVEGQPGLLTRTCQDAQLRARTDRETRTRVV